MAWTLKAHLGQGSTDTNGFTSSSIDTTGADLLVVNVADNNGTTTLSDSKGNSWTKATSDTAIDGDQLYYAWSPTVGTGHTFTLTTTGHSPSLQVMAWSGSQTSADPLGQINNHGGLGGSTNQTGSVTPSTDNELIVSGVLDQDANGNALSIDSGFAISDHTNGVGGAHLGGALAYLVQATAAAVNPTWSQTSGTLYDATIATFKPAPPPSAPPRHTALPFGYQLIGENPVSGLMSPLLHAQILASEGTFLPLPTNPVWAVASVVIPPATVPGISASGALWRT